MKSRFNFCKKKYVRNKVDNFDWRANDFMYDFRPPEMI